MGSIEEVAVGGGADGGTRKGWQLMACHTAPEFPEATAKDAITLGVLLGAGSFGVYWMPGCSSLGGKLVCGMTCARLYQRCRIRRTFRGTMCTGLGA